MDDTTNLKLPYIMAAQAQKHVTHNEAIRALDAMVQLSVIDRDLTSPPASPVEGARFLIAATASAEWAGKDGQIAAFQDNAWMFYAPLESWLCWVADEDKLLAFDGSQWSEVSGGGIGSVNPTPLVGINATADSANRLSVNSANTLFNHEGSDHRLKINKASATDTASFLFQDGFSGRAEMGLTGDDDFHFKVSADGASWSEAMVINEATGRVSFPATPSAAINVLSDSGRFAAPVNSNLIGAFDAPDYLSVYNSSTILEHGKFIQNNDNFGGSAGIMTTDIEALMNKIRGASYRRYGIEFHALSLTKGSGTSFSTITVGGVPHYLTMGTTPTPRFPAFVLAFYALAKTGNFLIKKSDSGTTIHIDGVAQSSHYTLTPAEGWRNVRLETITNPYNSFGYSPNMLSAYQANAGDEALIACMALVPGIVSLDENQGVLPADNMWDV